jgi:aminoglycoside phosphotransferase (APT) family kinase protein
VTDAAPDHQGGPDSRGRLEWRLLAHLRTTLHVPAVEFADPPAPISGGYDTRIFAFRLSGAPARFSGPLILRLLGPKHDPARALREREVQNAVAALGYPAPRVLAASADVSVLDGAFLIMERVPGRPMLEVRKFDMAGLLAELQLRLHDLDPEPLVRAVRQEAGGAMPDFDSLLSDFDRRVVRAPMEGLAGPLRWLLSHRPPEPGRRAICHGDFHPQNVLMLGQTVTGVLDWPNAVIADPAYDVAATRIILACAPMEMAPMPALKRWAARALRPVLLARHLAGYERRRKLDRTVLAYYEAAGCLRGLVRVAGARLDAAGNPGALNPLDASSFGGRLAARFERITGVAVSLPPVP